MNKKISQFELTDILYFQDTIPIVQENENKKKDKIMMFLFKKTLYDNAIY